MKTSLFDKKTIIQFVKATLFGVLSVVVFIGFVECLTYIKSGRFIGKDAIFFGMTVFEGTGFYLLPIQIAGIWLPIMVPCALGLIVSVSYITRNKPSLMIASESKIGLFVISISGIGAFSYFMGRSYPTNATFYLRYSVVACAILSEYYSKRIDAIKDIKISISKRIVLFDKIKQTFCLFIISCLLVSAAQSFIYSFSSDYREFHSDYEISNIMVDEVGDEIRTWADEYNNGNIPNMLVYYSIYIDEYLNRPSTETVCEQIDWFYKRNAYTYITFINEHKDESFVIDRDAVNILKTEFPEDWNSIINNYKIVKTIKSINWQHYDTYIYFYSPVNNS